MKRFSFLFFLIIPALASCGSTRSRTLIVSGPSGDPAVESALQKAQSEEAALSVRDVEIKRAPAEDFSVRLIGKDGGEKWETSDEDFDVKEVLQKVDEMPMRQEEIRRQRVLP